VGCGGNSTEFPPSEPPNPPPEYEPIVLDDQADAVVLIAPGEASGRPTQFGTAEADVAVTEVSSGAVGTVAGPEGGRALRFPEYRESPRYPRAVVTVTNAQQRDAFNPEDRPFTWGAVFILDDTSLGRDEDNGDNLIQRGLYSEDALFKAEVDDHRGACTVKGSDGVLTVRTPERLRSDVWYVVECEREGTRLRVRAWELGAEDTPMSSSEFGEMGAVRMQSPDIPISVGGKVTPHGRLVRSDTDQFNGGIAEAYLDISGAD
jgi:hypothetical protein